MSLRLRDGNSDHRHRRGKGPRGLELEEAQQREDNAETLTIDRERRALASDNAGETMRVGGRRRDVTIWTMDGRTDGQFGR